MLKCNMYNCFYCCFFKSICNIITIMLFIISTAYFPFFCGVLYRWKLYIFLWCRYCCVLKYRPALQYPFQFRKTHGQIGGAGCAEKPFLDLPLLQGRGFSFPARYLCGLKAYPFVLQKSSRFQCFGAILF